MRVIECQSCGEVVQGADDDELRRNLGRHLADEHQTEMTDDALEEYVASSAYEATDS